MHTHLQQTRQTEQNRRNGKTTKTVKSSAGLLELTTPRDRSGSYQPQLVPKRQVVLTPQLEHKVLSLYGMGNSYADISQYLQELYGYSLSDSELTAITGKVLPAMRDWQNRPLESLYVLIWLDGIYYKVRHEGRVVTAAADRPGTLQRDRLDAIRQEAGTGRSAAAASIRLKVSRLSFG